MWISLESGKLDFRGIPWLAHLGAVPSSERNTKGWQKMAIIENKKRFYFFFFHRGTALVGFFGHQHTQLHKSLHIGKVCARYTHFLS